MSIIADTKDSIASYALAYRLVKEHKLGNLLFISFLIYLLIAFLSGLVIWFGLDYLGEMLMNLQWIQHKMHWLQKYDWLLTATKIGLFLSGMFFYLSVYKFIFLAIASPLYAYISEKSAEIINQTAFKFELTQFLRDIFRGISISLINLIRQLLFTFIMILLSFIPVVGWVFNIIIIFIDAYYYGFSMIDYNCERHKMSVSASRQFISSRKGMAIGNGLIAYLSMLIPIVGIVFLAPLSVIAASIHFYKNYKHD